MRRYLQLGLAAALCAALWVPASLGQSSTKKTLPAAKNKGKISAPKAAPKTTPKKSTAQKAAKTTPAQFVAASLEQGAAIPMQNPAALIPFFEQLYRHQKGELPGAVRIIQYGDSHTAADNFTGTIRDLLQTAFGNGGSGFSIAGRPWRSYRRFDVKSGSSSGWHTDGLVTRDGDGVYGLGGVSMTTAKARESLFIEADATEFELFYYRQPGGGALALTDYGAPVDLITTDGDPGPAYYRVEMPSGPHRFELETMDNSPVRLFGWVAENTAGVTYEALGINGAQASIMNKWDETTLRENIEHRDPSLIVLAYGTNEAGQRTWTRESYAAMFTSLLERLRAAAPTASILVIGPPDRDQRVRRKWQNMERIGVIAEAQREAALSMNCAFLDLRAKMGGPGSMLQWVKASHAQTDHVHFTASGYKLLGEAVYSDLMRQYLTFLEARAAIIAETDGANSIAGQ